MTDRRSVLVGAAVFPWMTKAASAVPASEDEQYWRVIADEYDVTTDAIQLENGNWGMMARPVAAAYQRLLAKVNRQSSYYARRTMGGDVAEAKADLAHEMGVPTDDLVLTRNATESLKTLILGYNRLSPGDAVVYADLDYDSMQACMESLRSRRGVSVSKIALPEPATRDNLVAAYRHAFDANPRIRLVLLTHLSHRTGLVLPVREIGAMARARGIDTIVDAAHSWGQIEFRLPDLGCDFVGLNCHKWLGNPLGVGAIYVRGSALERIDRDPANDAAMADTLAARVHTGTPDYAAQLTLPTALAFQRSIGAGRRSARLSALRNRWVRQVRHHSGIEVLTPDNSALHGAITSFRLRGQTSDAQNKAIAKRLLDEFGIFTVYRTGVAKGSCVRVTPALFTSPEQVDRLAQALLTIA